MVITGDGLQAPWQAPNVSSQACHSHKVCEQLNVSLRLMPMSPAGISIWVSVPPHHVLGGVCTSSQFAGNLSMEHTLTQLQQLSPLRTLGR